jgi:signal transduction histidine kinase
LLDVSRIVRGELVMQREHTDLNAIAQQVVDDFREPAELAGSPLAYHGSAQAFGHWDKARLEQVMTNLLSNAIKYGAGKPIEVRIEATGSRARITVTDHGIGIAPEDGERIFARFERAAPVKHYSGLGLGLYVTRSIVEAHGGTIRVSSQVGQGSTFTIDLPTQAAHEEPIAATELQR